MSRRLLGQLPSQATSRHASLGMLLPGPGHGSTTFTAFALPGRRTCQWPSAADGKGTAPRRWAGTATRSQMVVNRSKTRASMPVGTGAGNKFTRTFAATTTPTRTNGNAVGVLRAESCSSARQRPRGHVAGLHSRYVRVFSSALFSSCSCSCQMLGFQTSPSPISHHPIRIAGVSTLPPRSRSMAHAYLRYLPTCSQLPEPGVVAAATAPPHGS